MSELSFHRVAATVFALVALGHAYRALMALPFQVGSWAVPVWLSGLAAVVAGSLSFWGFRSPR